MDKYFQEIDDKLKLAYNIANEARAKGYDPEPKVEIPLAKNLAERVEGLISAVAPQIKGSGVVERIAELEKEFKPQDWRVALKIAEEIAQEKFCKFKNKKEAMEIGIRAGFAYITVGVVASPLEGFVELKLKNRLDNGKEYFCLMYSGPIRSAGGTAGAVSVLIADYIRKKMGYVEYDPTEEEIKRAFTELEDYHERVTNLQYHPTEEEVTFIVSKLPVQIDGDGSEKYEVSNYKDLKRVESRIIRNGICLVLAECILQKAAKVYKQISKWGKDFDLSHWDFLNELIQLQTKIKSKGKVDTNSSIKLAPNYIFINDLVAGRPVLTHPLARGGFRLRYGRCRNSGFSNDSIHPATMVVLDNYIAIGTQLKVERPGKAATISSCDTIEGPIVKLKNGGVLFLETAEDARKCLDKIKEILFLGDILINYGDFLNRNHKLVPCGYNEEWYCLELKKATADIEKKEEIVERIIKNRFAKITASESVFLARKYNIPSHPRYTYHWNEIPKEKFIGFLEWMKNAVFEDEKIIIPISSTDENKRWLELIGIPHLYVPNEYVIIEKEDAVAIESILNLKKIKEESQNLNFLDNEPILDFLNRISGLKIRDKSGTFIGSRMGRPEKAKMRKLTGSPQVLFPVGKEGGKMRNFQTALEKGKVISDFPIHHCMSCEKETIYPVCENCGELTKQKYFCIKCNKESYGLCEIHNEGLTFKKQGIDINHYFLAALKHIKIKEYKDLIKGVRGTTNKESIPENLAKGILRSKYNIYVNKDGTVRYDMTEMPITHFKPKEIRTSVNKLVELGYTKDIFGNELVNEEQILELRAQDVILPDCEESLDETSSGTLLKIAGFIDELLTRFYGLESFYNLKDENELIGHLVVGLSPHTSAGIIARIIGFSSTQGFLAHPLFHSIMRRDCFDYNTFIPIMKDGVWRNLKIGELIESLNPDKKADMFGTLMKRANGYCTIGKDLNGKVSVVKINNFTKHKPSKILKIITEDGRSLCVTESHKFLIFSNKNIKKVIASDLCKGMKLVVPVKNDIPDRSIDFLDLKDYFSFREDVMVRKVKKLIKKVIHHFGTISSLRDSVKLSRKTFYNFLSRDSFPLPLFLILASFIKVNNLPRGSFLAAKRDKVNFPGKIPLNEEVLNLIGLYVAEGYSRKKTTGKGFYQVYFSATEKGVRERIKNTMKKYFYLEPSEIKPDAVIYSSRLLYELFIDILKCGSKAYGKRIPEMILNLPKEKLKFFLQGYYDGDGSVSYSDCRVACDSVSEGLLQDLEFCLRRYGIFTKRYFYRKKPGPRVREFYIKKGREIPEFAITKLIIPSNYCKLFYSQVGFSLNRKQKILQFLVNNTKPYGMEIANDKFYVYPKIKEIIEGGIETTYCLNVENNIVLANGFFVGQCDGDEACFILLLDALINFSRKFLPAHRGTTQDAPLVLTSKLIPNEVDDMVFDLDIATEYPLELYEAALDYKAPSEIKIPRFFDLLGTDKQYFGGIGFTHDVTNINSGATCSAYKSIPSMMDKVNGQMKIAEKVRAVDEVDVARLVIERHFIRDIKGNLRRFSTQEFRCVECNEKYRRPPLIGRCTKCDGKLLFTVSEGSVVKYLEPTLQLAAKYNLPAYLRQTVELTKNRIEGVFGKEKEKQEGLVKWFS
ncbi:DNA polymerase II large subunit [Candidatus Woesearchaeota archaeon]|nr:DNA polymerase II large subunit [Candidatus Woesearchaeota archaeon]